MALLALAQTLQALALALAAGVGTWLAWKRLSPAASQADASVRQTLKRRSFRLDLHGAYMPGMDLSDGVLHDANFAGANAAHMNFARADLKNANFDGTDLRGANLSVARNLTVEQLSRAIIDDATVLPDYIDRAALMGASG